MCYNLSPPIRQPGLQPLHHPAKNFARNWPDQFQGNFNFVSI